MNMTSKSAQFAALIGIDWASQRHALCLYDCATAKRESSILEHTPEAIAQWARGLQERFKGKEDRSLSGAKQRPAHLRTLGAGRTLLTKASSNMPASRCSIAAGPSSISRNRWRVAKLIPPPSAPWPSSGSASCSCAGATASLTMKQSTARVSNAEAHTLPANSTNNPLKPLENPTNNSYPNP